MKAKFRCNGKQMTGEVVKANFYTIWVNVEFKKKVVEKIDKKLKEVFKPYYKIIKRHKVKHAVVIGV
jgi:formylmethanofuran dehydrogenase subunit A